MSSIKEDIKKQQRQPFGGRVPAIHARLAEDIGEGAVSVGEKWTEDMGQQQKALVMSVIADLAQKSVDDRTKEFRFIIYPHDVFNNATTDQQRWVYLWIKDPQAAADSMETSSTKQGRAPVAKVSKKLKSERNVTKIRVVGVLESFFETGSALAGQISRAYERMTVEEKELMANNAKYIKYFTESSRKKPAIQPYIEVGADSSSRGAFEFASTPIRSI
ncbi:hypothetical protein BGX30_000677 [Mortierella sp. GBA39]|nr:hypothetical protein BGX30_000677 [Mortierella sp. GBA39]